MQTTQNRNYMHITALALRSAEQKVTGLLFGLVVVLIASYIYFLASAVVFAVERKEVQDMSARVNSRIATLEVAYLQSKAAITEEKARDLGFVTVAHKRFVERARYLGQANAQ